MLFIFYFNFFIVSNLFFANTHQIFHNVKNNISHYEQNYSYISQNSFALKSQIRQTFKVIKIHIDLCLFNSDIVKFYPKHLYLKTSKLLLRNLLIYNYKNTRAPPTLH